MKGDTRTGRATSRRRSRPASVVQVPLFVEEGEKIKVDTRTGDYIERVKG